MSQINLFLAGNIYGISDFQDLPLLGWEFFSFFPDQKQKNQKSPIFSARESLVRDNADSQLGQGSLNKVTKPRDYLTI
jgi:hypothetical protein